MQANICEHVCGCAPVHVCGPYTVLPAPPQPEHTLWILIATVPEFLARPPARNHTDTLEAVRRTGPTASLQDRGCGTHISRNAPSWQLGK